jgi:hypothetical protein
LPFSITVHGALAREVIKQNTILDYKISPILLNIMTIVGAINKQLDLAPKGPIHKMKILYPMVVKTMLQTLKDEEKVIKISIIISLTAIYIDTFVHRFIACASIAKQRKNNVTKQYEMTTKMK